MESEVPGGVHLIQKDNGNFCGHLNARKSNLFERVSYGLNEDVLMYVYLVVKREERAQI
jgi:hypothetical protein